MPDEPDRVDRSPHAHRRPVALAEAANRRSAGQTAGPTTPFVYCAWFQDQTFAPDDEDYEWPACFIVEADSADGALGWGDHLSNSYALRRPDQVYLRSDVVDAATAGGDLPSLPVVRAGYEAEDSDIGW